MLSVAVKWLSGEVVIVEVPYGTRVYQILSLVTTEPFHKVTIFCHEKVLSHSFSITENIELCILISDPPSTAIVYAFRGKDYYIDLSEPLIEKAYPFDEKMDRVYVDYQTYYAYWDEEKRQTVRERLGLSSAEHVDHQELSAICREIARRPAYGELRILWKHFVDIYRFTERMQEVLFPKLPLSKKQLLTRQEWLSYCVLTLPTIGLHPR